MYGGETEAKAAGDSAARAICVALWMLIAAVSAPVAAALGVLMPTEEATATWLQRTGSITTVLSLLALETLAFATSRLLPSKGGYGDLHKMNLAPKYESTIATLRAVAIATTIIGTLLWGYGDLLPLR